MNWREFEEFARQKMGAHMHATFTERQPTGFPTRFDMVSEDESIVGDAKYLTLVGGTRMPPAKFMEISGHVWLLERLKAERRFLVFGNQRRVAEWWIEKYGHLVQTVEFYFLKDDGSLQRLR